MKKEANDLRKGDVVVEDDGSMYTVVSAEHSMTGKRTACVQVHMKAIEQVNKHARGNSRKRYMPNEAVEVITLVEEECIFLYMDGEDAVMMRSQEKGCDQISMSVEADIRPWLTDGIALHVYFDQETPLYFTLPKLAYCTVKSTEVSMKHQRVTSSYKPAELENGVKVQVPSFIKDGDKITIDTEDGFTYTGKTKED